MQLIKKYLAQLAIDSYPHAKIQERHYLTQSLGSAGLRIQGGSAAATWQSQNIVPVVNNGVYLTVAAAATQAVPSQITWAAVASTFSAGAFLIAANAAGTISTIPTNVSSSTTSQAVALSGIKWPPVPEDLVVLGIVVISTSAANTAFTAATTNLDAANITTTFINITGPYYPATL